MARLHFLNVKNGDCIIIEHNSKHVTVVDVSNGNGKQEEKFEEAVEKASISGRVKGNFGCCDHPTNPIDFLNKTLSISDIFRFILTHPDMDHMDGIGNLFNNFSVSNFWDNGLRREKPDFSDKNGRYKESDWDKYEDIINKKVSGLTVISPLAGSRAKYFNMTEEEKPGGDGLYIISPNKKLVDQANETEDPNDGSYVLVYRSAGGKIVIAGDSHDETWKYILENHRDDIEDVSVLIAPHHGRDSDREYDFLDIMKPKYTLFGCAPSKDQGYSAWRNRSLDYNTNNQCGNFTLDIQDKYIDIYIENAKFIESSQGDLNKVNENGLYFLKKIQ